MVYKRFNPTKRALVRTCCTLILAIGFYIGSGGQSKATTNVLSSLASDVVQTAINSAVDGDTVVLPAGSAKWASQVVITGKGITITGGGKGSTTITVDPSLTIPALKISCGSKRVDISGISWVGNNVSSLATITVGSALTDVNTGYRLHDMDFTIQQKGRGILLFGTCEGVVDHCTFSRDADGTAQGVTVWGAGQYSIVLGDTNKSFPPGSPWATTAVFGDSHRAFIEDCDFNFAGPNDAAVEGYYGAKYVVRHCTFENNAIGNHGLDSGVSSAHSYEVYNNVWTYTAYPTSGGPGYAGEAFESRGGTGLIHDNQLIVPWMNGPSHSQNPGFFVKFDVYRASGNSINLFAQNFLIDGHSPYDTNQSGTTSAFSGRSPTGWPCLEMIGSTGPITLYSDHSTEVLSPFFAWNNTYGMDASHQTGTQTFGTGPGFTNLRASGADLVVDTTDNTKVTSASRTFATTKDRTTNDQNSWLQITGGTGFTAGWYQILSTSGNAAVLDRPVGKTGSKAGAWTEYYTSILPSEITALGRDYFDRAPQSGDSIYPYTPYVYPHPLVSGMPGPPDNLRVVK